jgi:integrase
LIKNRGEVKRSRRLYADLLTANEIERLLRACSHRAPTGIRNRAMLAVAWRGGLRIGEVLALRPKDIDLGSGTIVVQHGKGDKRRVVGIDVGTTALLARWLEVRRTRPQAGAFPNLKPTRDNRFRAVESRQAWGRRLRLAAFAPSD